MTPPSPHADPSPAPSTCIRVVSLKSDAERRAAFSDSAAGTDLPWRYFDGYTQLAPGLDHDADRVLKLWGVPLRKGEIGCYSSHWALWNEFLESEYDQMIVIEDDVLLDWNFIRLLTEKDFSAQGIPYLRLFALNFSKSSLVKPRFIGGQFRLVRFLDYVYGAQAYVLTRHGAEVLSRHCQRVCRPVDVEMDRFWAHGLQNLCVFPFPALERLSTSRIRNDPFEAPPAPLRMKLQRTAHKLLEKVRKTVAQRAPGSPVILDEF